MSLAWLLLLGLLYLESTFHGCVPAAYHQSKAPSHPHQTVISRRRSGRIVRIMDEPQKANVPPRKIQSETIVNDSISSTDWREYNMWQALRADGQVNMYLLFFTIYISYLVYVLF
ncbi:hypothetical protein KR009_007348 [Drosophila setifemur]|nr:hypothetical protein KR009_007348 [Drosophila setifemur]